MLALVFANKPKLVIFLSQFMDLDLIHLQLRAQKLKFRQILLQLLQLLLFSIYQGE